MKYFFFPFFAVIAFVLSFEAFADVKTYNSNESAKAACTALYNSLSASTPGSSSVSYGCNGYGVIKKDKPIHYRQYTHRVILYPNNIPEPRQDFVFIATSTIGGVSHPCETGSADSTGLCVSPVTCPASGTSVKISEPRGVDGTLPNYKSSYDIGGCAVVKIENQTAMDCWLKPDTSIAQCGPLFTYEYSGEASVTTDKPSEDAAINDSDVDYLPDGDHTKDTVQNVYGDISVIDLPDGAKVETKVDTTVETKDNGVVIETKNDVRTITQSDGIVKETTVTTVTTTNSDGSRNVRTTTDTKYTQNPRTVITQPSPNSPVNWIDIPSITGGSVTVKDETFDSGGNKTGGTETTTTDGNGDGEGEGDPEVVTVSAGSSGGTDSWWETSYPEGFSGIVESHTNSISDSFKNSSFASTGLSDSGSVPSWSIDLNINPKMQFGVHVLKVDPSIWAVIKLILLCTTLFSCRKIIFGG